MLTGHPPYLQMEQRGPGPHSLTDFQVVLLPWETGRTLVVGWQHFYVDCSNGRPEERGSAWVGGLTEMWAECRVNDHSVALRTTTQILFDDANGVWDYVTDCLTPLNEDLITPHFLFLTQTASAPSQVAAADILQSTWRLKKACGSNNQQWTQRRRPSASGDMSFGRCHLQPSLDLTPC